MNGAAEQADRRELTAIVRDFYDDYAICLDDGDLGRWVDFFTDDGIYKVISAENFAAELPLCAIECTGRAMIKDRVAAIATTTVYEPRLLRHMVSGVRVNRIAETIEAQANFVVFEALSDREPHLLMMGRYLDKIARAGATLRFRE